MSTTVKISPTGGEGGQPFEDYLLPEGAQIKEIHVFAADYIDALQIVYQNAEGQIVETAKIGGLGGVHHTLVLEEGEYVTGISGHSDSYINSLRFHTNKRTSETYGRLIGDKEFRHDAPVGKEVVGFCGRADWYLDAVGIIARDLPQAATSEPAASTRSVATETKEAKPKDLQKVEGIGPKIATILNDNGILDLADLAESSVDRLKEILEAAGSRYKLAKPDSWPEQAALGAKGDWDAMKALQKRLKGGRYI